ncbi:hypothetical protein SHIRM173S_08429 [Streptomyces hirsutus]
MIAPGFSKGSVDGAPRMSRTGPAESVAAKRDLPLALNSVSRKRLSSVMSLVTLLTSRPSGVRSTR